MDQPILAQRTAEVREAAVRHSRPKLLVCAQGDGDDVDENSAHEHFSSVPQLRSGVGLGGGLFQDGARCQPHFWCGRAR